jgi:predicted dithiol-disulfide oxidoreductase (DUF899 family)
MDTIKDGSSSLKKDTPGTQGWPDAADKQVRRTAKEERRMNDAMRQTWLDARLRLMQKEKALTRLHDEIAAERRALPMVEVVADYRFDTPDGERTLAELFDGKSQLIIYHFMLGPDAQSPCKSCSFWAEHFDGIRTHLLHRDANLIAVSRAPLAKIDALKQRFGWRFPWVSSGRTRFNFDFGVSFQEEDIGAKAYNFGTQEARLSELPGLSVFLKDESGRVFQTYSAYSRGLDGVNGTYQMLDLLPKGRAEEGLSYSMAWLRLKDEYQT